MWRLSPECQNPALPERKSPVWLFAITAIWHKLLQMEFRRFTSELKSRGVYRAAVVYSAGSWALLQVADVLFPIVGLPDWSVTAVLVIAAAGFPVAMILSWAFDLTPGSPAPEVKPRDHDRNFWARVVELNLILLLVGLVGYLYLDRLSVNPSTGETATAVGGPASIAVMPFVNLSDEKDMEYLGDGLAEEILNLLTKLNALNVAARTSSFYFKGKQADIRTIGQRLGVAYVLEGSVRHQAGRIRVTTQLIKASDGYHLWSETYERGIGDLLALQDEIATAVVDELQILLSPESDELLANGKPAIDARAYDYYLRGRAYLRLPPDDENLAYAVDMFDKAIALYPNFADAYSGKCDGLLTEFGIERDPHKFSEAETACQRALTLDRRAPNVYISLGRLYLASGQYQQAIDEFTTAQAINPSQVESLLGLGDVYMEQGELALAEQHYRAALEQQPNHWSGQMRMGKFLFRTGRAEEAIPFYQRVSELMPDSHASFNSLGAAYFVSGQFEKAYDAWNHSLALAPSSLVYANLATSLYYLGRFDEAIPLYHKAVEQAPEDYELWGNLGDAYRHAAGRDDIAKAMYGNAIKLAEKWLQVNDTDAYALAMVAHYHAAVGDRQGALELLARAQALAPDDIYTNYSRATALVSLGESEQAMGALERALGGGFPRYLARSDPNLGKLKELPRFEAAMAQRE